MNKELPNITRTGVLLGFIGITTSALGVLGDSMLSVLTIFALIISIKLIGLRAGIVISVFSPIFKELFFPSKVIIVVIYLIACNLLFVLVYHFTTKKIPKLPGEMIALVLISIFGYQLELFYAKHIISLYMFNFLNYMPLNAFNYAIVLTSIIKFFSGVIGLYVTYMISKSLDKAFQNNKEITKMKGDYIEHKLLQQ